MGRLRAAWKAFWKILRSSGDPGELLARLDAGLPELPAPAAEVAEAAPAEGAAAIPRDAVYTLTLLQREGRLIDFLMEEIEGYDDAQVGAAVRQIHAGCRQVLRETFDVGPVTETGEGESATVEAGFDASRIRVTGRVSGSPPWTGVVRHRGWQVRRVKFPQRDPKLDPRVIQPAEIEV